MAAGTERWTRNGVELERRGRPTAAEADRHGELACFRSGCRCSGCITAQRRYFVAWRASRKILDGRPAIWLVPAGPTRRLLLELRAAGWTLHAIAQEAGIAETTVRRAAAPGTQRIWSTTAAAVREVAEVGDRRRSPTAEAADVGEHSRSHTTAVRAVSDATT